VTEPAPAVCEKTTTVELFEVTMLSFASSTLAVSVFVEPDATLAVFEVKTSLVAAPTVIEKVEVSLVRPLFEAVIVTEPAVWPVTVSDATPEEAVALPSPVTEPAPAVWAKVTTVELSLVTMLLLASSIAAVKVLVEPEATLAVPEVKTSFVADPGTKATEVPFDIAEPLSLPLIVAVPALVDEVSTSE